MTLASIVSAVLTAVAIVILMAGVITALALADAPSAVAAAAGLVSAGVAGLACLHLRRWWQTRRRFRARPLTGWRIPAAALLSLAFGAGAMTAGFRGSLFWTTVLALLGAVLGVRAAVARRMERAEAERALAEAEAAWSNEDREWLLLTGAALPEGQERQR